MRKIGRILKILSELPLGYRLATISRKTGIPLSTVRRILNWLTNIGVVEFLNGRYRLSKFMSSIVDYLARNFDIDYILDRKFLPILLELESSKSFQELLSSLEISEKTLKKRLSLLMEKGIIRKVDNKYVLVDDKVLNIIVRFLRSSLLDVGAKAEILWARGREKLVAVPKNVSVNGAKTAFSVFSQYGIEIETTKEYYFVPKKRLSLEEVIVHSIIASGNDPYKLALVAVLLAKHYDNLDHTQLKNLARMYGVGEKLNAIEMYIHGVEPEVPALLPYEEFKDLARLYGIEPEKLLPKPFTKEMLEEIGSRVKETIRIYLIGGAAMILKGYKERTKDIDVLVENKKTAGILKEVLEAMGYQPMGKEEVIIFEHPTKPRIDLNIGNINHEIFLTDSMIGRADKQKYGKLNVLVASDTDIVLMKSVSGRARDILDINRVLRHGYVDWKEFLEEMLKQERLTKKHLCIKILNTLEELQEKYKLELPIYRKIKSIATRHMVEYAYRELGLKTPKQIQRYFGFPESTIRRILKQITQEKKNQKMKK